MALDTRELFARILKCEAESEGEDGMKAIATLIMNRATVPYGEFARVNDGGNVRNILTQYTYNVTCALISDCYNARRSTRILPEPMAQKNRERQ